MKRMVIGGSRTIPFGGSPFFEFGGTGFYGFGKAVSMSRWLLKAFYSFFIIVSYSWGVAGLAPLRGGTEKP
jgi:glucose dehydrogenase